MCSLSMSVDSMLAAPLSLFGVLLWVGTTSSTCLDPRAYGAVRDGLQSSWTVNTKAIQQAFDAATKYDEQQSFSACKKQKASFEHE